MPAAKGNNYAKGNNGGRSTLYKEEYADQAYKLCLLGATDAELADFFEVTERTINNWKKEHQEFFQSLKEGKTIADAEVAQSLYDRAKGYFKEYQEDVLTKDGAVVTLNKVAIYPPDPTSIIFWLKNRQSAKWKDKRETDLTTGGEKIGGFIYDPPDDLSED